MPLNPKPQAHGKRKIQAGVSTGSSVSSLALDGNTLQLNQSNSQPQRTVDLSGILPTGDITGVTAGDGLTGGGNSGAVTLAVGVGTGLDVSADAVTLDLTEVGFGGGANRLITDDADGTVTTEANLTFDGSTLALTGNQSISGYIGRDTHNYIDFGTDNQIKFRINDSMSHKITTSSSNVVFQPLIDGKDFIFNQYDGTEVMRITDNQRVGIGLDTPTSKLHVKGTLDIQDGNQTILMGAGNSSTSRSNDTLKLARVGLAHYHNAEEPVAMLYAASNGTDNTVVMGGGTSNMNAATKLQFATAVNDATTAGTVRASIQGDSNYDKLFLGSDTTLGFYRYSNRLDFYISSNPRIHLDASKLYSATSGGPLLDLTPTSGEANYGFVDDANTGMSRTGADTLVLMTGGTNAITIDSSQNVIIPANLTVQGTTTTIDSTTLSVKDKNIEMGVVTSPSDTTADGGGITLKGATDKTFNWVDSTDSWTASEHLELASGKSFRINGNNVLNQTTLGSTVVSSSLTSVGTLTTLTVDDITLNASTISDAGDLTIDAGGDITLDADGADIRLSDGGTQYGKFRPDSNNFAIHSSVNDANMLFKGEDGGSTITALTLDMANAGNATFNQNVTVPSNLLLGSNLVHNGDTDTYLGFETDTIKFFANNAEQLAITDNVLTLGDGVVLAPHSSDNFTIDSPNGIILDGTSAANGVQYHDGGTELLRISNSSSNPIIRTMQDSKDLIFQQYDAAEVMRITDDKILKVGGSSATGNHIFVERDAADTTYDFIHGRAKYPRIRFEDRQANASMYIWHLGNQLRLGTNAGSSTTTAMYVQNGQPSDGLAYGFVAMNSGVGMGTTSSINSSRVSIVDTAKPLTLAYDGSNYTTFKVSSGGALTIDAANDINLDTYTGVNNFLYRGTEKFRITAGASSPVIFQPKADAYDMAFNQYDGTEVMRITDNQRVGIGTTSPSKKLHVAGTAQIDGEFFSTAGGDFTAGSYRFRDGVLQAFGTDRDVAWTFDNTNDRLLLVSGNSASNTTLIHIGADPTDGMYVAGKVGIGTDSPSDIFHVYGSATDSMQYKTDLGDGFDGIQLIGGNPSLKLDGGGSTFITSAISTGLAVFDQTNGAYRTFIANDGKVGIGTTSPNSKMTVSGDLDIPRGSRFRAGSTDSNQGIDIYHNNDGSSSFNGNVVFEGRSSGGDVVFRNLDHGQDYKFYAENNSGTEQLIMKIDGTEAAVGIGEGSTGLTTANGAYLHVTGSSNLLANFLSSDGIGEIRVGDSSKYTRLLTAGNQFKIMPFDGVELMVLDGSTEKVGIGTNAPSEKFNVESSSNTLALFKSTDNRGLIQVADDDTTASIVAEDSTLSLGLTSQIATTNINIDTDGKLGIGITDPVRHLDVNSGTIDNVVRFTSSDNRANIQLSDDDTNRYIVTENNAISLGPQSSFHANNFNIVNSDVGIGTTSPGEKLHVAGNGRFTGNLAVATTSQPTSSQAGMRVAGIIQLDEKGSVPTHAAGTGILWVKNDSPANLYFTDDDDNDIALTNNGSAAGGGGTPGGSDTQIQFNNGGSFGGVTGFTTTDDGSDVTLTSATSSKPVFTIENTNADTTPPGLTFYKNTTSPSSSDQLGSIKFDGEEATSSDRKTYWEIQARSNDVTNTTPNGILYFYGLDGDTPGFIPQFQFINSQFSVLNSDGVGPTIAPTGTNGGVFKTQGSKMRLQAKSDSTGEIHAMCNYFGINTTSPQQALDVNGEITTNALGQALRFDNRDDLLIRGTASYDMEITAPQDMAFGIDSDNNETTHAFLWKKDSKTPSSAGTELMRLNEAGNLGIGTSAPYQKLDIRGNLAVDNEINFDMDNNATAYGYINWDGYQGGDTQFRSLWIGDGRRQTQSSLPLAFFDGTTRQVGIGTTTPLAAIHINGGAYQQVFTRGSHNHTIVKGNSDDTLTFATGAPGSHTARFKIQPTGVDVVNNAVITGSLGVGTASPAEKLDVAGNIRAEASSKSIVIDPYFAVSGDNQYSMISGSAGLALYAGNSYTDVWIDGANSRSFRLRSVASDGSFDAGSFLEMFPSSVGATGDAVANIRASSGDLQLLSVGSNNIRIDSHNDLNMFFDEEFTMYSAADGNPRMMIRDDSVAAMEFNDSHFIHFKNATSTKMSLDTANGRLGIGVAAPSSSLHINGAGDQRILLKSSSANSEGLVIASDAGSQRVDFSTDGANVMSFTAADNIGIGTTSPNVKLDVNGDVRVRGSNKLYFGDTDTTEYIRFSSDDLQLHSGDDISLNVVDDVAFNAAAVKFQDTGGNTHLTVLETGTNGAKIHGPALVQLKSDADSVYISAAEHNYFDVGTRNTYSHIFRDGTGEFARFKNARLGIGTTAPARKLHVAGDIIATNSVYFGDGNSPKLVKNGTNDIRFFTSGNSAAGTSVRAMLVGTSYGLDPNDKSISIQEQSSVGGDTAGYGQIWVKNDSPNKLYFTDDAGTDHDLTAGGGSGTINSGVANSFAVYAADGTTLSDSIYSGSEPDGSLTYDLSSYAKLKLWREDGSTGGTNGFGQIEFGNTDFSSDRSSPNASIQVTGGGSDQTGSNGGVNMNFKTIANSSTTETTRLKITSGGVVHSASPFNAVHINTSMTTEGNPGTTRTINMTEDTHQYIGQVIDGGIVAFELPTAGNVDIGDTFRVVWETRNAFGIGPVNSEVKLTRGATSIQINGSTSDLTLKSNSSSNTFRGIAEIVCIDDGTGLAGAVAYVVQNTEV